MMRYNATPAFDMRLFYAAAVAIGLIGYFLVFRPIDDAIANEHALADSARVAAEKNESRIARRAQLQHDELRLERELHDIDVRSDRSTIVARFVRDLDAIGAREHVTLLALSGERSQPGANAAAVTARPGANAAPGTAPSAVNAPTVPAAANASAAAAAAPRLASPGVTATPIGFESIPLELTLAGGYVDLLHTMLRLSDIHVLAQVDVASMKRMHGAHRGQSPQLSAVLHVTLFHTVSNAALSAAPASSLKGVTDGRTGST